MFCMTYIFVWFAGITHACNFGDGCPFPCNCKPRTLCHSITGCVVGCKQGYSGSGCLTEENIARNKETADPYMDYYGVNEGHKAVDGYKDIYDTSTCTKLHGTTEVWWRVNFDGLYRISQLTLYMPPWLEHGQLVSIYSTRSENTLDLNAHVLCLGSVRLNLDSMGVIVVRPPQTCIGTSLIIYRNATSYASLTLCEVEVQGHLYSDCDINCGKDHYKDATSCNAEYGCIATCDVGKSQESFCKDDCRRGTYGVNCELFCGFCKDNNACSPVNGSCTTGCQDWYIPDDCKKYIGYARLNTNKLHLTSTSSTIHVVWDPVWYNDPDLRQHYGYQITYGQSGGTTKKVEVRNTREDSHREVMLTGLDYNTYYSVVVYPFRYQDTKIQYTSATETKTIKTACVAPGMPQILNYTKTHNWNGTVEIGRLHLKVAPGSGCDSLSRVIVSGIEQTRMFDFPVRFVTITLYAATVYHVTITAENTEGLTTTSNPFLITVGGTPETIHANNNIGLYIGIAILFAVLVGGATGVMLCCRRRKRRANVRRGERNHVHHNSDPESKQSMLPITLDTNGSCDSLDLMEGVDPDVQEVIYENTRLVENKIKLSNLGEYIKKGHNSADRFDEEFNSLPKGHLAMCEAAELDCNLKKNRYTNVKPYDHTRVLLAGSKSGDYINANYIKGYGNKEKKYIATQGPKSLTVTDFWHMIWQEDINVVVMLTPIVENLKKQSELYWPLQLGDSVVFGDFRVSLNSQENTAYYMHRMMELNKEQRSRNIHHFQFLAWPDKNRPEHNYSILDFIHKVNRTVNSRTVSPILVHCSAGIGRTGTYIALDYLLEQADAEQLVDVTTCVHLMRTQRTSLVQTLSQYKFLYEALYHHYLFGNTTLHVREFSQQLKDIKRTSSLPVHLQKQFKALDLTRPKQAENADGSKPDNRNKNRDMDIIPDDKCRPYIMTVTGYGSNYINAVTVDMYQKRDAVIVTQVPLPNTVNDFWSLVLDHDCGLILLLDDLNLYSDQSCQQYWPAVGCSQTYGKTNVSVTSKKSICKDTTLWNMTIKKTTKLQINAPSSSLSFIQYTGWPQEVGDWDTNKCEQFLDMMSQVNAVQHQPSAAIIVQCLNGSRRSGIYCAARIVLDRITVHQEVDIPMATQMVVSRRPSFIASEEDYLILHRLAHQYVQGFETYVNLQ